MTNAILNFGGTYKHISSFHPLWGYPGGRSYFISRRIGRTFQDTPLEVVGLDQN
jgi:hypothetical protein